MLQRVGLFFIGTAAAFGQASFTGSILGTGRTGRIFGGPEYPRSLRRPLLG